jgi:hypothetical protein
MIMGEAAGERPKICGERSGSRRTCWSLPVSTFLEGRLPAHPKTSDGIRRGIHMGCTDRN